MSNRMRNTVYICCVSDLNWERFISLYTKGYLVLCVTKRGLGLIPKTNLTTLQRSLWRNKSPSVEHNLYLTTTTGFAYIDF
jgi:hypothetical protein